MKKIEYKLDPEKLHSAWVEQCSLAEQILQSTDVSIITCGHCGHPFLNHYDAEEFTCPHCLTVLDPSDCPDLFHDRSMKDIEATLNQSSAV